MRTSSFILVWMLLGMACTKEQKPRVPDVFVNSQHQPFSIKEGVLFLENKPFSGYQFVLYENGDTMFVTPFLDGKEEGETRKWYPNGRLQEIRYYAHGKKEGEHKGWWEDGSPKFVYHFTNDLTEGNCKEWYASGVLFRNANYVKGYEEGLQQAWFNDGSIQANYIARNGRNYGNTGTKHCKSIYQKDSARFSSMY